MKNLDEIKEFIELLPVDDLTEISKDKFIYYGEGFISTGSNNFRTTVKILRQELDNTIVKIESEKALVKSTFAFKNVKQALRAFNIVFQKFMN